jgi:hypothetical protein
VGPTPQEADTTAFVEHVLRAVGADPGHDDPSDTDPGATDPEVVRLLGRVAISSRPVPASVTHALDLPASTTCGDLATRLLLALREPDGPRCRSLRSALAFIRESYHGRIVEETGWSASRR